MDKTNKQADKVFINTNEVFIYTETLREFKGYKYFIYENDDVMNLIGNFSTLKETKEFIKENNLKTNN